MRIKKISQTLLATFALLAGGLPVLLSAAPASAATSIPNLPARWQSISSPGSGTTCALATNGTIWCWGKAEGTRGVAWDSSKGDPVAGTAIGPTQVGTATNWVAVEVGAVHACAKNSLSELWCWGANANGQLGTGNTSDSKIPVKVKSPSNKPWYSFSLGYAQTCGVQATGIWCWGNNSYRDILPDSSGDGVVSLPRFYSGSDVVVDTSTEIQIGLITVVKTGSRIWVANIASFSSEYGTGFSEVVAPSGKSWTGMSVRQNVVTMARPGSVYERSTFLVAFCGTLSDGSARCFNSYTKTPIILGADKDIVSINIRQATPRDPICALRNVSGVDTISCYSFYGTYNSGSRYVFRDCYAGIEINYSNFQNSTTYPVAFLDSCTGKILYWTGTTSPAMRLDIDSVPAVKIKSIEGNFFQGSVTGESSYSLWGRIYLLTSDGRLFVMGDGKYGERQDGLQNDVVTDTWAAALTQSPSISRADRSLIPKTGGASVTLSGSFLVGVTGVTVGDSTVSTWAESPDGTSLSFTSPSSSTGGTVNISVTTSAGTAILNSSISFGDSPGAPVISGLSPTDGAVTVGWSSPASSGTSAISSYVVNITPGNASCTWTVGPLNCTVSGLTNGTTYRATVRAYSAVGPGLLSANSAAFVPYKAPSAPPIVSIAPGDGQITVTWSAAANNGSAITRYDVEAQPGGNSCSTTGTGTSCTISPLPNGTPHSISVYATNDAGGGEVATSETLITPRTLAGAPTNVAISPGDKQLGVSWRAPSSNGGSAVTSYTVTAQPGSVTCTAIAPSTTCNLLGLSNGSVYSVTVVATNPAGDSVASTTVTGSPVTIPGKPTISATEPGSNSVLVRWRAPSATGGASVTSYTVVASPGGNSCTTTGAVLFCTVTGLDNGTTYAFTVTATNTAGTGSASASYNGVPATIASPPRSVTVSPVNSGITASWAAPSYDGGTAITGYVATVRSTGDTCTTNASTKTCTFSGLVNGSTYVVDVVATNNAGSSEAASSSNVTPRTVPSKPVQVTLTPGASTIRVSWAAPLSDGGSSITSYLATATPGSGLTCTSTGTYCDFLSLTPGTNYSVTVVAVNAAGTGSSSTSISAMPFTNPGAPNSVGATADDGQVLVTWAAPTSNGGSDITGYVATATQSTNIFTCTAPSTATSCLIKGLTNGSKYSIKVSASNGAGAGPESTVATPVTPRGIPNAPTLVSVDPQNQSLVVKWRAITTSADNNGAAISKYIAKAMPSGQTCQVDGFTTAGNGSTVANTTCTITGLTNGAIQSVTVTAVNEAGASSASNAISTTPRSAPGAPVGVKLTPLNGGVSISWNAPIDSGGTPIIRYTGS
ncbi:MAG: hypothetical protein EBU08_06390, partial [Micrococcales bacterium]|nr:hypothetical protein [Micrococcales bacterium]